MKLIYNKIKTKKKEWNKTIHSASTNAIKYNELRSTLLSCLWLCYFKCVTCT